VVVDREVEVALAAPAEEAGHAEESSHLGEHTCAAVSPTPTCKPCLHRKNKSRVSHGRRLDIHMGSVLALYNAFTIDAPSTTHLQLTHLVLGGHSFRGHKPLRRAGSHTSPSNGAFWGELGVLAGHGNEPSSSRRNHVKINFKEMKRTRQNEATVALEGGYDESINWWSRCEYYSPPLPVSKTSPTEFRRLRNRSSEKKACYY